MALFTGAPRRRSFGGSRWRLYLLRHRTRKELLLLNDRQLADIGLTQVEARREGYKPFWKE
ncbi:DUF1127 domain-containing protein [Serratia marcescens]|uniref:DUF1127 domain-containing protein n=1 Tax=Serratia TaxID=613 RepID=UPI0018D9AAA3|nr:DUF1127 domain-containing protein [Serratia marcescens]MBH2804428.1 DUF1127 domain-containing protein [Serratia marcescens]MBN5234955.1 DUF1127 domain-containing protein [Serratia marcescens]MBN5366190.1 DUF1127 domain-containing protein [Serratia marcescens]